MQDNLFFTKVIISQKVFLNENLLKFVNMILFYLGKDILSKKNLIIKCFLSPLFIFYLIQSLSPQKNISSKWKCLSPFELTLDIVLSCKSDPKKLSINCPEQARVI